MVYSYKQAGVNVSLVTVISTLCHPLIMSYQWFLVGHLRLFEIEPITLRLIRRHQRYFLVVMSLLSGPTFPAHVKFLVIFWDCDTTLGRAP